MILKYFALKTLNIFDHFYKKKLIYFLKKNKVDNIDIFIDVGAHKGESINFYARNLKIKNIFSFEPSKRIFNELKNNKYLLSKKFENLNIYVENFALGTENKKIIMKQLNETSSSTIKNINKNSKYYKKKFFFLKDKNNKIFEEIEVNQIRLDNYIVEKNLTRVDFIKIDTEGYEFEVLKGAERILSKTKYILFEHHYDDMIVKNYTFGDINKFLKENNFKIIYKSKMPFRKTFEYLYINKII